MCDSDNVCNGGYVHLKDFRGRIWCDKFINCSNSATRSPCREITTISTVKCEVVGVSLCDGIFVRQPSVVQFYRSTYRSEPNHITSYQIVACGFYRHDSIVNKCNTCNGIGVPHDPVRVLEEPHIEIPSLQDH